MACPATRAVTTVFIRPRSAVSMRLALLSSIEGTSCIRWSHFTTSGSVPRELRQRGEPNREDCCHLPAAALVTTSHDGQGSSSFPAAQGCAETDNGAMTTTETDADVVRIFLCDDHTVVRAGLAAYLGTEPGMTVVGEANNGQDAINRIAVLENSGALPDVVL